jgi:hypothetical protein
MYINVNPPKNRSNNVHDTPLITNSGVTLNTRWFKYDRDDLCVNKSQFVPVISEPPFINLSLLSTTNTKYLAVLLYLVISRSVVQLLTFFFQRFLWKINTFILNVHEIPDLCNSKPLHHQDEKKICGMSTSTQLKNCLFPVNTTELKI